MSAFGFGGTNAHVIVAEAPPRRERLHRRERRCHLLALSAKDPNALRELAARLAARASGAGLADLCFSANTGRDHFAYRRAFIVDDAERLRAELSQYGATGLAAAPQRTAPQLVWVFGESAPARGCAGALYALEPEFRRALEQASAAAAPILRRDLLPDLLGPGDSAIAYPATAALIVQHALHALLSRWGVAGAAVHGTGVGEYAAACAAGALDWNEAVELVARRELLLASLVPGAEVRQTLQQWKTAVAALRVEPLLVRLSSGLLGRELAPGERIAPAHWLDHLYASERAPARPALSASEGEVWLSLDAAGLAAAPAADGGGRLQVWCGGALDHRGLFAVLAGLYERGANPSWSEVDAAFERDKLGLPSYPFQRQRCWLEFSRRPARDGREAREVAAAAGGEARPAHPFLGRSLVQPSGAARPPAAAPGTGKAG